jgi:hypothetical protein
VFEPAAVLVKSCCCADSSESGALTLLDGGLTLLLLC